MKRLFVRPALPQNPDGKVLLHLGCGDIVSPEFINVDIRPAAHVHYVRDVTDLSIFPDGYADLVYACHLLEHIPRLKLLRVLWDWRRILKRGGVLRLSVPDFDSLLRVYFDGGRDVPGIVSPLLGGQESPYNVHYSIFTETYLSDMLQRVGFQEVRRWDPQTVEHHDVDDWASRNLKRYGREYPVSLNLEAAK